MLHLRDAVTAPMPNAYDDNVNDGDDHCLGSALHIACSKWPCPSLTDIQGLITKNALQVRDPGDKWLPLHRLCRRQPSLPVIQHVVEAWPESVRQWTADAALPARLPIHLACQYGASLPVIQYLAQVDPLTLAVQTTYRRYTALDYAHDYYRRFKSGNEKERQHDADQNSPLAVIEWLEKQQEEQQQQQPVSSSSLSSSFTGKSSLKSTLTMSTVTNSDREGPESSEFSSNRVLEASKLQEQLPPKPTKSRPKKLLSLPLRPKNKDKRQQEKQKQALQDAVKQLQAACWEEPPCFGKISKLIQGAYGPQAVREARTDHGQYTLLHQVCWNAAGSIAALEKQGSNNGNDIGKIMTCLIQAWPESVQQATSAGYLPLHLLLSGCSAKRAIEAAASRHDPSSTSTRSDDDHGSVAATAGNGDILLVQLVEFLMWQYPAALIQPAKVDGFLPLHCATYCGAPVSVVKTLVQELPRTLDMIAVVKESLLDDAANTCQDAETLGPGLSCMSPLALAHRSIMGDMTKRPEVIAWLTSRLQEQQEQQRQELLSCQQQERRQEQAAVAAMTMEQRALLQQEELDRQQQQLHPDIIHTDVAPGEETMPEDVPCAALPDAVASNPPPADNATLHPFDEPENAVSQEEEQQDTSVVQTESASLLKSATDAISNAAESPPTAATDETVPCSSTTESERQQEQQQDQQQRARFTFLFRRSG